MRSKIAGALRRQIARLNMDPLPEVPRPVEEVPEKRRGETPSWIHIALFLITFLTTTLAGAVEEGTFPERLLSGLPFSITLMTILLFHEMGHYLAARRFGLRATLPFFIPLPHWISPIGTLGAIIKVRSPIRERRSLLYVGAMGPLAGFAVCLPVAIAGIIFSEVRPLPLLPPGGFALIFGDSILFKSIAYLAHGPIPPGHDIFLSPLAWAGWIGFLITSLNLMPLGQLDGGHILYSLIGRRQLWFGWMAFSGLIVLSFFWPGWIIWILMTLIFLRVGHPRLYDSAPLDRKSRVLGWVAMIIFPLTFVPRPVDVIENNSVFPVECPSCERPLEPSGLALFNGKLLTVSDDPSHKAVFELRSSGRSYKAVPFVKLSIPSHGMKYPADLEGLAPYHNLFYIADERNRRILMAGASGKTVLIDHNSVHYSAENGITFSEEANAGFEGIAVDPEKGIFYIANERDPAIIYILRKEGLSLRTVAHIDMGKLTPDDSADVSDLFFEKGSLYVLIRKLNVVLKLDPRAGKIKDRFDFSETASGLYRSPEGYGFAEGLCMDREKIYLSFDGNGNTLGSSHYGLHGMLAVIPRPRGF